MSHRNWKTSSSRRRGRDTTTTSASAAARGPSATTTTGGAATATAHLGIVEEDVPALAERGAVDTLMEGLVSTDGGLGVTTTTVGAADHSSNNPSLNFTSSTSPFDRHTQQSAAGVDDASTLCDTATIMTAATDGVTAYREADGPTIYAPRDRDDLSQITSSLAGNTVGSSAYYFGSAATGRYNPSTVAGRRGSGGEMDASQPHPAPGSGGMENLDEEAAAELAELEGGDAGMRGGGAGRARGAGAAAGGRSVAQSVDGLDYILSAGRSGASERAGAGAGAGAGGIGAGTTSGSGGGNRQYSGAATVAGGTIDHVALHMSGGAGAAAGSGPYSRRGGGGSGGGGSGSFSVSDVRTNAAPLSGGLISGIVSRGSGTGSGTGSGRSTGSGSSSTRRHSGLNGSSGGGSRYASRAYASQGSINLCATIQSHLPPPVAQALSQTWRQAIEPCWIQTRRLCCTLRHSIVPSGSASPRYGGGGGKKTDASSLGSGSRDDYFSKLLGGAAGSGTASSSASLLSGRTLTPAEMKQYRIQQGVYILKMLAAGAFCGVTFLGLERMVTGGRNSSRSGGGPPVQGVDEYGRAMDDFRSQRAGGMRLGGDMGGYGNDAGTYNLGDGGMGGMAAAAAGGNDMMMMEADEGLDAPNFGDVDGGGDGGGLQFADGMGGKQEWVEIPPQLENLADVDDVPLHKDDLPYYWHIPRAGGATMNDILGGCLKLTIASEAGGRDGHDKGNSLKEVEFPSKQKYINVDTHTAEGIQRAKDLDLVGSGLADVFVTSLFYDGASVFDEDHRARFFTLFRNPVDRAVSLFHFIQDTVWRRQDTFDKVLSKITIDEYYKGGMGESNWMTRFLSNEHSQEIDEGHLEVAKKIIGRKCLVGLLDEKSDSMARFEAYFGWKIHTEAERECVDKKLNWAWPLKHRHDDVEEGSELWNLIAEHNKFDLALYEYIVELYAEQGKMFTA